MKPQRTLALKRERLADLESGDLRQVVGGTHIATDCGCLTHGATCEVCPTPTLPINVCVDNITDAIALVDLSRRVCQ